MGSADKEPLGVYERDLKLGSPSSGPTYVFSIFSQRMIRGMIMVVVAAVVKVAEAAVGAAAAAGAAAAVVPSAQLKGKTISCRNHETTFGT